MIQPVTAKWERGIYTPTLHYIIPKTPFHHIWRSTEYNMGFWSFSRVGVFNLSTMTELTFHARSCVTFGGPPFMYSPKIFFLQVFSCGFVFGLDCLVHLQTSWTFPKVLEGPIDPTYSCRVNTSRGIFPNESLLLSSPAFQLHLPTFGYAYSRDGDPQQNLAYNIELHIPINSTKILN